MAAPVETRAPTPPGRVPFPATPAEFDADPRVSYSKLDGRWILEDDDGSEWEYDESLSRWMPSLDEALLIRQGEAYGGPDEGADGSGSASGTAPANGKRKASNDDEVRSSVGLCSLQDGEAPVKKKKTKPPKNNAPREPPKNTAVYVTSLPLNVTLEEVNETFARYGVIAEEIDSGNPRIKLYKDESGTFKGDALVVYFRPESVGLAIQMLDDTDFRLGEEGPAGKMRVTEADRSYKKQDNSAQQKDDGEGKKKPQSRDQKKIIKKTQKLNSKLADWSDDDTAALTATSSRFDKVVILKHMFTLKELEDDPAAILDIKEDIREECAKHGPVTNVQLFDREPDGVVSVRYGAPEAARSCVRAMDGRSFGGQRVEAYIFDGQERFKKGKKRPVPGADDESEDEGERMDKFGEFLEAQGK